ncbi:MAG: hypothetical protein A4E57_04529 [Syntrophorhabdaceae bacterium PtaU1.Bin034]|nr:MAG: hypothetical protein A4E57_04529 [Syntrophorhabdaceae bacterium PtaU1.Bin034]
MGAVDCVVGIEESKTASHLVAFQPRERSPLGSCLRPATLLPCSDLCRNLGQRLCVPPFRMVCPFQTYRNVIQNVRLVSRNFFFSLSQAQVPVLDSLFVHCIRLSNNSFTFFLAV